MSLHTPRGYGPGKNTCRLYWTFRYPYVSAIDCGVNMEYRVNAPGCPATCADPNAADNCDMPPQEGCTCKTGYVLNEKQKCVVLELCGKCRTECNRELILDNVHIYDVIDFVFGDTKSPNTKSMTSLM